MILHRTKFVHGFRLVFVKEGELYAIKWNEAGHGGWISGSDAIHWALTWNGLVDVYQPMINFILGYFPQEDINMALLAQL